MHGRKHVLVCFAAGGLCGTGFPGSAVAGPRPSVQRSLLPTIDSVRSSSAVGCRSTACQVNASPPRLDLRPPMNSVPMTIPGPVARGYHSGSDADYIDARPGFGTREAGFPVMTRPETLLHRVHREGVPIIRLWNSKSALLSIGFNQKGKPGLWLIQKIP